MSRLAEPLPAGVHRITLPTPFPVGPVNVYLLDDEPLTLIDAGLGTTDCLALLEDALVGLGRRLDDIGLVLLTHHHPDHASLAAAIARRSGAQIAALGVLADVLADFERQAREENDGEARLMLRHGVDARVVAVARRYSHLATDFTKGFAVDRVLAEGETIALRHHTLTVAHRPGHSHTDTVFLEPSRGILFGGDHLLARISSNAVVHELADGTRTPALLRQRRSLQATATMDATIVLSGHGPPIADPAALIERRLHEQQERADRLLGLLGPEPVTAYELGERLLGPSACRTDPFLAVSEVVGHLDLLREEGLVVEHADADPVRFSRA